MTNIFTPDKLETLSLMPLHDLCMRLDVKFQKQVNSGWHDKNQIELILEVSSDVGRSLDRLRAEVIERYKAVGWSDVLIQTSEEQGERPGLIRIALSKVLTGDYSCSLQTNSNPNQ